MTNKNNKCLCCDKSVHDSKNINLRSDNFMGISYKYERCESCGLVFCSPIPNSEVLTKLYSEYYNYDWYTKHAKQKRIQAWHRAMRIKKLIPKDAKTLDVGCGHGFFVNELLKLGFDSYGYEYGLDERIISGDERIFYYTSLSDLEMESFDFISLWHSLEHTRSPIITLVDLKQKMSKNGKLLIAVPNFNSIGQKLRGRNWVWLQQPYVHLWHFNSYNIRLLLRKISLEVDCIWSVDTWDAQIYDWGIGRILNFLNRLGCEKMCFYAKEWARLVTTPISYILNPLHRISGTGSELLILSSKND